MDAVLGRRRYLVTGAALLLVLLAVLLVYKVSGSLAALSRPEGLGAKPAALTTPAALEAIGRYFAIVWPALVLGLLVGATVRAFIPASWLGRLFGEGGRAQLMGGVLGMPLMLCSCCVTPVFTALYDRGGRLAPSLALMLASPGLNVAALALTFMLFSPHVAAARLAATLVAVFLLPPFVARLLGSAGRRGRAPDPSCEAAAPSARDLAARFLANLGRLTVVTVPMIAGGVLISSLLLPFVTDLPAAGAPLAVLLLAGVGVIVALPTFFEIPLALLFLQLGAPEAAAAAFLFAGPIVNLPSLLVLGRETGARVPLVLGASIFLLSLVCGAVVSLP